MVCGVKPGLPGNRVRPAGPRGLAVLSCDVAVNTGPWTLDLVSSDTGREAMQRYSTPPESATD